MAVGIAVACRVLLWALLPSSSGSHSERRFRPFLILEREAMGHLIGIGAIERFAEFATINLRVFPDQLLDLFRIVVPPLQMPGAELPFGVFFIAGALPMLANLYFP